jgi:gamma-glutamyl-gamma-aminobutyrate hydrolase PuuD
MGILAAMAPLIGISMCLDDRGRWKANRDYHYIATAYSSAVETAGGTPIYLPIQSDPSSLLRSLDGLLIPGGDDLPPAHAYPSGVEFDLAPEEQLDFDRHLLADALQRRLPVLGICYGMQLLAAVRGGTLVYDIPTDRKRGSIVCPRPMAGTRCRSNPVRACAKRSGQIRRPSTASTTRLSSHPVRACGSRRAPRMA